MSELTQEDKLTEKELLNFIDEAIESYIVSEQLTEIVKGYFKYDYLRNDPECRSIDEILEEKARQQKPTVTREWLWGKIGEFPITSRMEMPDIMTIREKYLIKLVNEAGVEVIK